MSEKNYWLDVSTKKTRIVQLPVETPPEKIDSHFEMYGEQLVTKDFRHQAGEFAVQKAEDFDRARCIAIGKTAMEAITQFTGEPARMTSTILRRMYILGIGPYYSGYYQPRGRRFTGMNDYNLAIGSPLGQQKGRFDHWAPERFQREAAKIEIEVGGKPRKQDYLRAARRGQFPGERATLRIIGGYSIVNELLGYPYSESMNEFDYQEFGRHVKEINDLDIIIQPILKIIASRQRGPSLDNIFELFSTLENFNYKVASHIETRNQLLQRYRSFAVDGFFPISYLDLPDEVLLQRGARMDLIKLMAPWFPNNITLRQRFINSRFPDRFAYAFSAFALENDGKITPGYVERAAQDHDLDGYIWPRSANYADYLFVPQSELDAHRSVQAAKRRAYNQKNRPAA